MDLTKSVYVMNDYTYDVWEQGIFEEANKRTNPLPYLMLIATMEVAVDNRLMDGVIEVYDKDRFNELRDAEGDRFGSSE